MSGPARTLPFLALAGLLAGCGGARSGATQRPAIPAPVAHALAARSDALATSLERGDACAAARDAAALRRSTRRAVASGRVPRRFRAPLLREVSTLSAAVPPCPPPQATPQAPPSPGTEGGDEGHDHGKHKGRDKHGGKGQR